MASITAHMVVKNEDLWVYYAAHSVLPYVDRLLVTDTGSTDHTRQLLALLNSPKLELTTTQITSPSQLTQVRQAQLAATTSPWIWLVDGDEIYPEATAREVVQAVQTDRYEGVVVRRRDLLGDIYHRQDERVGEYRLFGARGHLVTRLVNRDRIKGLHYRGDYPLEGFYDQAGTSTRDRDPANWYLTQRYLYHTMYLKRSTQGANLASVLHRHKYKLEKGLPVSDQPPEVFSLPRPAYLPDPLAHRSLSYEILANIITPMKKMKRKLLA